MDHRSAIVASFVLFAATAHAEPTHSEPALPHGWFADTGPDGTSFVRQVVPATTPAATTSLAKTRTIYLNHSGATLAPGVNDSATQTSSIVTKSSHVPGWNASPADWTATVACMTDIWSRFGVTVSETDPGATPHIEALFGGSPADVGLTGNIGGISPFAANCSVIEHSIVFAFTDKLGNNPRSICEIMSQEIAHSYGLDHELLASDPMTYLAYTGKREFQDQAASCGESTARPCGIAGTTCWATQNSVQLLTTRLGAADRDNTPPSVGITTPADNATVAAGFAITATATDNISVASVAFYVDGDLVATRTAAPYQLTTDAKLAAGAHTIVVEATDAAGNTASQQRDITIAAAAAGSDSVPDPLGGCSTTGSPSFALIALVAGAFACSRRRSARPRCGRPA